MIITKSENIFKKMVNTPGIRNIAHTPLSLKYTEIVHRYTYAKRNTRMAQAIERYHMCACKKSHAQIDSEVTICKRYWGCYPLHYFRYDLYRDDKQLSQGALLDYIPEFFFYYLFLPYYTARKFENFVEDKHKTEQMFRQLSISQPATLSTFINGRFFSEELKEIDFVDLVKLVQKNYPEKLFVKPTDGQGGYGIFIFHLTKNMEYVTKNNVFFNKEFFKKIGKKKNYIIQSGLIQDTELSRIYPHSVNTFRIATENINGTVRVLCATLRMGRNGLEVDNSAQNGLMVQVNIDTGTLGHYANSEQVEYFENHPDTHFVFNNYKMANWNKVKDFVIESARKLPQFIYLGWDIALVKTGPIALETNLTFGLDHYQIALGGLRETFRISDPGFYWKHKGKRI